LWADLSTEDRLARFIEDTNLDESLVNIESNIADHRSDAPEPRLRAVLDRASNGPNYLFELEVQPGGPRG
jgi:hypothetical protein